MRYQLTVTPEMSGRTVSDILRQNGWSRRQITALKRTENGILLDGKHARTVDICYLDQIITLERTDERSPDPNPELFAEILYEDEHYIVFDKPSGMPTHESHRHRGDALSNVFAAHCKGLTFRSLNRLDRETSGCVLVAKDAHAALSAANTVKKIYCGICEGIPDKKEGRIEAPIARENGSVITRCVRSDGKPSTTLYKVVQNNNENALCDFELLTGRTHQIRVHMSYIGHVLAGDSLYGKKEQNRPLALCCREISFRSGDKQVICNSNLIPVL